MWGDRGGHHQAGGQAIAVGADVSQADQVETAVGNVAAELGPPAVLVNNAGVIRDNLLFKMSEGTGTRCWASTCAGRS